MGETHEQCKNSGAPESIFSTFEYKGLVRKCIMSSKYRSKLFAPLKILAKEAADIASKCDITYEDFAITPIPLGAKRARERGFNQAGLIAKAVAERFSISYQDSILVRNKETKAQHKKTRQERFKNLENAFIVKKRLKGRKILVVDDICTTGATFLEAARALYSAGALEVRCFSLAKEF
jgi:competence protein ComFC